MYSHQRTVQDWVVVDFVDIVAEEIHQGVALLEVETHPHKGYQGVGPQEVHKIQEEVVMDMNSLQVEGGHLDTTQLDTTQLEDHL